LEKALSSQVRFAGKVLKLRVDEVEVAEGRRAVREVVEYPGAVTVLPLTEYGEVLMVRQYRYPVGEELLELPAGKLEAGEDPLETAKRELAEETGYRAREMRLLLRFYTTPGFSTEEMHLFLATGLTPGEPDPDPDEFITVEKVPLERAREMVAQGQIRDAKSIVGLLAAGSVTSAGARA